MKRILLAILVIAPLPACTYVNETGPGYAAAPTAAYSRGGSYEAERQAYEYGRRDGAMGR